jgi:hypothetical protein
VRHSARNIIVRRLIWVCSNEQQTIWRQARSGRSNFDDDSWPRLPVRTAAAP